MEVEELTKLIIFVLVLVVVVGGIILLLKGKGGDVLASIRNLMRFGRG